ncbi:MAG: glycosyltransferase family 4 protein [Anaerolineae bacterium]
MKVAFVSFDFGEYCVRTASALATDHQVLLVAPEQLLAPHLDMLDPAVELVAFQKPRLRQAVAQVRTIMTIVKQVADFAPDVVHIQQGHLWLNMVLPLLNRYPLVMTIHDPRQHTGDRGAQNTPQWISDLGFRQADQVIVHGRQLKGQVVSELGIPEDRVHVIPMIAHGQPSRGVVAEEQEGTVLFFGRIWGYKGLDYLIRAEPRIASRVADVRIIIAGEGEDMGRYRALMRHPEHFEVHNEFVSEDKQAELFRRACVVTLPYIEATQSAVIPVAYTFGKPVVATTVGSLPDLVDDGATGLLVPPRDESALADAIVRLLQDRTLRHRMGANGKAKLDAECAPTAIARQTQVVYAMARQSRHSYAISW